MSKKSIRVPSKPKGTTPVVREPVIQDLRSRIIDRILGGLGGPVAHDLPGYTKDISYSRYIKE
jgi:hypothetical protein